MKTFRFEIYAIATKEENGEVAVIEIQGPDIYKVEAKDFVAAEKTARRRARNKCYRRGYTKVITTAFTKIWT